VRYWDWEVRFSLGSREWIRGDGPRRERVEYSLEHGFFRFYGFVIKDGAVFVPDDVIREILKLADTVKGP
jgi:hypothetical protein